MIATAIGALVVVIAAVVIVVLGNRPTAPRPDPPPAADGGSDVAITTDGDRILRDGQPWWLLGYNSFVWSGDCGNDDERMSAEEVEAWFASMRHDGHGAVRLFFFVGWSLDRLDAAVESAKRHDIYLTITLDDAIGGCGETDKDGSWFEDQDERDTYREHMTQLLERYRGENTIAWFEYFNEPDPEEGALREFYDEMGAVADEIDPDRLFASGTVAPSNDGREAFRELHDSPGVDIASLHEYDEEDIESNHGPDTRQESAGKPVIVGEFGMYASTSGEDCARDFSERADRFAAKAEAYTTIDGYVGGMAWAWQPGSGDECAYGNLDVDSPSQAILRTFVP